MKIRLLNAKRLAEELERNEVSPKTKGYYLLASFLLFVIIYYSGLPASNPLWSWLSIYEAVAVCVITIIGVAQCYVAAGGDENPNFVVEFTCLYVPVSITTNLAIWPAYWAITIGFRKSISALTESHFQIAANLARIGGDFFGLFTFIAVALVQFVTFYRISKLFNVICNQRS